MSGVHFGLGAFVVVLPGLALPAMAQPCLHDWAPVTIPARVSHAMAYDSDRDVVVCVGGLDSETACRTWEYDGESWSLRNAGGLGNPANRQDHAMAYDSQRHVTVLYGGDSEFGPTLSDTWEWNGQTWTQRNVSGPGARRDHAMAFDAHRSVTVLFGGFDTFDSSTSIWEWEGTAWVERDVIGPVRRSGARLAYDPIRMESLPFGGWYSTNDSQSISRTHGDGTVSTGCCGQGADHPAVSTLPWIMTR